MSFDQQVNGGSVNSNGVGADLLVVTNDYAFLRQIQQDQSLWTALAGFIDDYNIERFARCAQTLGDAIERHDPRRDCIAAGIHVQPRADSRNVNTHE
jgi:hypothetical protein